MTRTPARTARAHRDRCGTRPPRSRRGAAGGLLAGLAVTASAVVVLPSSETPALPAAVSSQAQVRPSVVAAPTSRPTPRAVHRASRGGPRTALPPVRFVTRTVPTGSTFSGNASWYGGSFQGRRTASGERFNTYDFTAASKTLTFGTRLRVCRYSRCVIVRINDRGPYVGSRILDLSQAARNALGYDGVAFVTATPVETRRVAVRRAVHRPRPSARRPVSMTATMPPTTTSAAVPVADQTSQDAPSLVLGAALLTLAGSGVVHARRRRTRHS
jgi:rare lipoprotein A